MAGYLNEHSIPHYSQWFPGKENSVADVLSRDPERFAPQPEGHADDLEQPHIVLGPGGAQFSMRDPAVSLHFAD